MNTSCIASSPHRTRLLRALFLALALPMMVAIAAPGAHAQEIDLHSGEELLEIRLADGTVVVGRVVEADAETVTIETASGARMTVPRDKISRVRLAEGRVVDGAYWFEDPNHTRLFLISPTGRALERGEGYISAFMVLLPFVAYGITDHFTLAGGTPLIPEVIGRVIYIAPKLRVVDREGLDVAVGALSFFSTYDDFATVGVGYGVATFGNSDRSATVGAGWGYFAGNGESGTSDRPVVMAGGDLRVARTVKLVSENFFVPGERGTLLSGGVRLFGERMAVDFGIAGFVEAGSFFWFPAGNFVYNFGRR